MGWVRVGRLLGPSRARHTPPISSVTGTASNRVPGLGSQHWARHSPGLPSGLTVEGMRSGPSRLDCVWAGSVMAHRGSSCLVAWGSCSIYCSALTILKLFIWGRGPTLCFAMGPTNSLAILSEEGSGQESGPMGAACPVSGLRRGMQLAGWPCPLQAGWHAGQAGQASSAEEARGLTRGLTLGTVPANGGQSAREFHGSGLWGPSGQGTLQGTPWGQS